MRRVYLDASAVGALLKEEEHSRAVRTWLGQTESELVSSDLLEVELRRLAARYALPQAAVSLVLRGISLSGLERSTVRAAGLQPNRFLRALDAIHLQAALDLGAEAMLTYDKRLAQAAEELGLGVIAP